MNYLSKEEALYIVSGKVADYSKEIYMFIPLDGDQPVVMYTSLFRGIPSKHYLGLELKLKYSGGLYVYNPESKPFDINEFESYMHPMDEPCVYSVDAEELGVDGKINREWAIAIAKHFKLTAEDLK